MAFIRFLVLIFISSVVQLHAQVKTIKVAKETAQPVIITLAGESSGECKLSDILRDKKVRLINNADSLRIERFDVTFNSGGSIYSMTCKGDSLSNFALEELAKVNLTTKPKLYIEEIKVIDKLGNRKNIGAIKIILVK